MGLEECVRSLRIELKNARGAAVPDLLQGVSMDDARAVLHTIDLDKPDIVGVVFALLDDTLPSWFKGAPPTLRFCDGATTAHLACHVGILQRGARKLDREGRDYWIKPLRELGGIDPVFFDSRKRAFVPGHPVAKSANSAYRLSVSFATILRAHGTERLRLLRAWIGADQVRARRELQAKLAAETDVATEKRHVALIRACVTHYATRFLPDYEVVYTDDGDGDRITPPQKAALTRAGVEITLGDAMPDVLLWSKETDSLWVIEAVISDGEVDLHKQRALFSLAERCRKPEIGFTTAYRSWKEAATRQGAHRNIAPGTFIWILEDPSKHYRVDACPELPES